MKVGVRPVDVQVVGTPAPVATLAELKAHVGLPPAVATDYDDAMMQHLAAASQVVQGPYSVTRQCFTDHDLRASYATRTQDLLLPGGRVKAGTSITATAAGETPTVDVVAVEGGAWYARFPVSDTPVVLEWTAGWAEPPPPLVKEACLRLAAHYWATGAGGEKSSNVEAEVRDQLMRAGWA